MIPKVDESWMSDKGVIYAVRNAVHIMQSPGSVATDQQYAAMLAAPGIALRNWRDMPADWLRVAAMLDPGSALLRPFLTDDAIVTRAAMCKPSLYLDQLRAHDAHDSLIRTLALRDARTDAYYHPGPSPDVAAFVHAVTED